MTFSTNSSFAIHLASFSSIFCMTLGYQTGTHKRSRPPQFSRNYHRQRFRPLHRPHYCRHRHFGLSGLHHRWNLATAPLKTALLPYFLRSRLPLPAILVLLAFAIVGIWSQSLFRDPHNVDWSSHNGEI